jgi:virulence-associated protein VagC
MQVAEIVWANGSQLVKLPEEFQVAGDTLSIRRQGDAIVLEPVRPEAWPAGFFDRIRIDDPAFVRPQQGQVPPAPTLD